MLILAPMLAFIIPFVFFGLRLHREPLLTTKIYITTLIITCIIWASQQTCLTHFPIDII